MSLLCAESTSTDNFYTHKSSRTYSFPSNYKHSQTQSFSTIISLHTKTPHHLVSTKTSASQASTPSLAPYCTNGPESRNCWKYGFDLNTDQDKSWPTTGKSVKYELEIMNTTLAVDGISRQVLVVNGRYPGPVITADWGDTLSITVKNKLKDNGTSIHWHGMRQLNSNNMDGTNGITECPLAPGEKKTYTFLCTQHGTTCHFSVQYTDGVVGTIVINGPASANYDIDLGPLPITDWYHEGATSLSIQSQLGTGVPPTAENGLINGTMVSPDDHKGSYNKVTMKKGIKYRVRLINTSTDNHFKVSLDGHTFEVITADFVPIVPYTTDWIFLAIGQRYDVIITADQPIDNYWFRAEVQSLCGENANAGNIKSIFSYEGAADANPTTTGTPYAQSCLDESPLTPFIAKSVPSADFLAQVQPLDVAFGSAVNTNGQNVVSWTINDTMLHVDWSTPTLGYVRADPTNDDIAFPASLGVIKMPVANQWYYWIIQAVGGLGVPHPIHLHGHDFSLLGSGTGVWDPSLAAGLNYDNPPRRDVAMLPSLGPAHRPATGWMVIAFQADNPGSWLMHCHIAWHISEGLGVQFLERESEIAGRMDLNSLDDTCPAWRRYATDGQMVFEQSDSGLRRM